MGLGTTIAAVIVTFNRCDKLRRVMDALLQQSVQPDRIFVIDNASTDETEGYLKDLQAQVPRVQHVRLPNNIGGAGGFYEGTKLAYEEGYDYIWLSDDDAYPEPTALETLLTGIRDFEEKFSWAAFLCLFQCKMDGSRTVRNEYPHPRMGLAAFLFI